MTLLPQALSQGIPRHPTALHSGKQGCLEGVVGAQYLPYERPTSVLLEKRNLGWPQPFRSEGAVMTVCVLSYFIFI